ncbi:MAG TPA: CopG family transcriptional regulator [Desulfuromonadales bacterium]|nr:CopG family transcriptional regulator [Desulfuromonadales bacterium]
MASLSLRILDEILHDVDDYARQLHLSRAEYVRKALEQMNMTVAAQQRRTRLMETSLKVRMESMKVNSEFSACEDVPNT